MDIPFIHQKRSTRILPFTPKKKWGRTRSILPSRQSQRLALRNQAKPTMTPSILKMASLLGTVALFITSQIIQWVIRVVYGSILVIGLILLLFAGILALCASNKVPPGYWHSVWQGESVFFLLTLAGLIMDVCLMVLQLFIGAQQVIKRQAA